MRDHIRAVRQLNGKTWLLKTQSWLTCPGFLTPPFPWIASHCPLANSIVKKFLNNVTNGLLWAHSVIEVVSSLLVPMVRKVGRVGQVCVLSDHSLYVLPGPHSAQTSFRIPLTSHSLIRCAGPILLCWIWELFSYWIRSPPIVFFWKLCCRCLILKRAQWKENDWHEWHPSGSRVVGGWNVVLQVVDSCCSRWELR